MQLDWAIHASLTQKWLSQLSIKAPYVALRFLCDPGLLQCYSCVSVSWFVTTLAELVT